jgi:hypothetical protein
MSSQSTHSKPQVPEVDNSSAITQSQPSHSPETLFLARKTYNRVINIQLNPRIGRLIRARKRNQRTRGSSSSTSNRQLTTRDIKLCTVQTRGGVEADMLDAEQIIAGRDCGGDFERYAGCTYHGQMDCGELEKGFILADGQTSPAVPTVGWSS